MPYQRSTDLRFTLDTNRVNARGSLPHVTQLEQWAEDGIIDIVMTETAHEEIRNYGRSSTALDRIFWMEMASTSDEYSLKRQIQRVLFQDGANTLNEQNDVSIVFTAAKHCLILVTADGGSKRQPGGILGHREQLRSLGVRVMTDAEAVALARDRIGYRDSVCRMLAELLGHALPNWVGKD